MKFHHIGVACLDIDETRERLSLYMDIKSSTDVVYDAEQDAKLQMLEVSPNTRIELVAGKMVETVVKKRRYLYHTCWEVENIEDMIKRLIEQGYRQLGEIKPAVLFGMKSVVFLSGEMGMIELLEE